MKKFFLLPLFLAWLLSNITSLHANPITFRFTSLVTGVEKALYPDVNIGDPVVGSYIFESSTPDSNGDPQAGVYLSPGSFEAQVGRVHLMAPLLLIEVLNRNDIDRYTVAGRGGGIQLSMVLGTANLSAFTNDSLPLLPPLLSSFENNSFIVYGQDNVGDFLPKITTTPLFSLQTVPFSSPTIPEPSTWLLLGSGLAGIILWRKRTA